MDRSGVIRVVVPSAESVRQSSRYEQMSENQVAEEYLNHPMIPYNQTIRIDKIGVLNYDFVHEEHMGMLCYKTFRQMKPESFPVCVDPTLDYDDQDQVSPAVIISGEQKYQIDQQLWFPFTDIANHIMTQQARLGRKLLPIEVFIDERNQWLVPLFNLGK